MKSLYTIAFLTISNVFMTFAWYGHLKFRDMHWAKNLGLTAVILISWGIALFEYTFQVPANKIGYRQNGGPYNLVELKTIQEAVSLIVFMIITLFVFRTERLAWNHLIGFALIILAVFFVFKKW